MEATRREMAVGRWWPAHAALLLITLVYTMAWGGPGGLKPAWIALPMHLVALTVLYGGALWLLTGGRVFIWRDGGYYRRIIGEVGGPGAEANEVERAMIELPFIARRGSVHALAIHVGMIAGLAVSLSMDRSDFIPEFKTGPALVVLLACCMTSFFGYRLLFKIDRHVEARFVEYQLMMNKQ